MSHELAPAHDLAEPPRRSFLVRASAALIGAIVGIAPLIPGVPFLLDPVLRKKKRPTEQPVRGKDGYVKVTTIESLPADGSPQQFAVIDDLQDAWNFIPNQEIGTVWLRKVKDDQGKDAVKCLSTVCPHLGCSVDYKSADKKFFCPCHTSSFDLDGNKLNAIPPRNMDGLEIEMQGTDILVRFKKFRGGTPNQEVVG